MISFAQNFEDVLLERAFRQVRAGFYVDLGAQDPVIESVTKHFYDRGWSGINVEPGPSFPQLAALRPRDINLNVAVTERSGPVTFYESPTHPGLSTVEEQLVGPARTVVRQRVARTVPGMPLNDILAEHARDKLINFLKIDIEGHEGKVIASTAWQRFRPEILVIESTLPMTSTLCHHDWEPVLLAQGYVFVYFDGLNRFYVRSESIHHRDCFQMPVNVFDGFRKYDPDAAAAIVELTSERDRLRQERDTAVAAAQVANCKADELSVWRTRLLHKLKAKDAPGDLQLALKAVRMARRFRLRRASDQDVPQGQNY